MVHFNTFFIPTVHQIILPHLAPWQATIAGSHHCHDKYEHGPHLHVSALQSSAREKGEVLMTTTIDPVVCPQQSTNNGSKQMRRIRHLMVAMGSSTQQQWQ
jgi:hypothetical protein